MKRVKTALYLAAMLPIVGGPAWAGGLEVTSPPREAVFEFAQKPVVTREGDRVTITLETKGLCDVTVAVEDDKGRIVRHLASGVLGPNAPAPFRKDAKKQTLVWDGKNDKGEYVEDFGKIAVRVSLGLKPRFERTLYWSPYKAGQSGEQPTFCVAPEGVYIYSIGQGRGNQCQRVMLFDHDGRYVRTLYPFPASDLERVQGLTWLAYPPDGRKFPLKNPPESQTSLLPAPLTGGPALGFWDTTTRMVMTQDKEYVYLIGSYALRLAKPGSGKPSVLKGPEVAVFLKNFRFTPRLNPGSVALSPDGKWLYITGYSAYVGRSDYGHGWTNFLPCVTRMPSDCSKAPEAFIGPIAPEGTESPLNSPNSVAVDKEGRLYIADMFKGLLIYSPEGKRLHRIDIDSPAFVQLAPDTGEIWVASWIRQAGYGGPESGKTPEVKKNIILYRYSPYLPDHPPAQEEKMVLMRDERVHAPSHSVVLDFTGGATRMWFANAIPNYGSGPLWRRMNVRILELKDGTFREAASFENLARRDVVQSRPPRYGRQRVYVNPADGCAYIAEQIQPTVVSDVQCFDQLVKIDPETGRTAIVDLPFDAEDMAFDHEGRAYLRTDSIVARYDSKTWREAPIDYGRELNPVTHYGLKPTETRAGLFHRGGRGASGKIFGMGVNVKGELAVSFYSTSVSNMSIANPGVRKPQTKIVVPGVKEWTPRVFPGRSTYAFIHVWDKYGRLKFEDAVPGLGEMSDFKIDRDDNLYMVSNMMLTGYGKAHPDRAINTLVKMPAGKGRILTDGKMAPIPLGATKPDRPPDARGFSGYRGNVWLEGAEWALGGIGLNPRDLSARACHCEANVQIALDDFGRSFVPALHRYEVMVVDTAGNTVLRIGRYGNVEDGMPLVRKGGPPSPRAIGGDEAAFVSPKWLGVHSDRRLFVSDRGNYRVVSVKLGYHATERVALKNVPEGEP